MKRTLNFLKGFTTLAIVMFGAYLLSFYIQNGISFTSVFCGIIGFLILFPAINEWDKTLWGRNRTDAHRD